MNNTNIKYECISLEKLKNDSNLFKKFNDYFNEQNEIVDKLLLDRYIINYQYNLQEKYIESVNERQEIERVLSIIKQETKDKINKEIKDARDDEEFQLHFKNTSQLLEKDNMNVNDINIFMNIFVRPIIFNNISIVDDIINLINPDDNIIILETFTKGIEKICEEKTLDIMDTLKFDIKYKDKIQKTIHDKNYDSNSNDAFFIDKYDYLLKSDLISNTTIEKLKEIDNENYPDEQKRFIKIGMIQSDLGLRSNIYRKSTFLSIKDVVESSLEYLMNLDCQDKYLCYLTNENNEILITIFVTLLDKINKYQEHMFIARNVKYFMEELVTGSKKHIDLAIKLHSFCAHKFSAKRIYFDPLISMFSLLVFKYKVKLVKNTDKFMDDKCFYRNGQYYGYYIIVDNELLKWFDIKKGGAYYKYLKYKTKYINLLNNNFGIK